MSMTTLSGACCMLFISIVLVSIMFDDRGRVVLSFFHSGGGPKSVLAKGLRQFKIAFMRKWCIVHRYLSVYS